MKIFFDSSALAKRYIEEPGTRQVNDLFAQADEILVSIIILPEIISALSRMRNEKKISLEQFDERKHVLMNDFQDFGVCEITPEVIQQTILLVEQASLKTLDAIHLASAVKSRAGLFVSSDIQQLKAAKAAKIKTLRI